MKIQLSDHFTYGRLLRFTLPSMAMIVIASIYGVVDGLFISNLVGKSAFAAVNLILPFVLMFGAFGYMLGTGGSALVAKTLGEGNQKKAAEIFSMIIYVLIGIGVTFTVLGIAFLEPIAVLLGATPELLPDCVLYGRILLLALTPFLLQSTFQTFLVVAEKPHLGLWLSIASGLTNMTLDYLFMAVFGWGVAGAAAASALSQVVGSIIPLFYFLKKNRAPIRLTKPVFHGRALAHSCANGSSEMMTNVSISLVSMLYNFQLIRLVGPDGVSAYGIIMYVSYIFSSMFFGYAVGCTPVISYHYGAANHSELTSLLRKSLVLVISASAVLTVLAELLALPSAAIFVGYDTALLELSSRALRLYSISFLFSGFNIFASAFFTALNNGFVSAFISFLRSLVLQVLMIFLLPLLFPVNGIWLAVTAAEVLTLAVSIFFFVTKKKRYHY